MGRRATAGPRLVVAIAAAFACRPVPVAARELWTGEDERQLQLRTSLKASLLPSHAPDDPVLFPQRDTAASLWRLRLEPELRASPAVTIAAAYEQRLRIASTTQTLAGLGVLPSGAPGAYRIRQLDWGFVDSGAYTWRHQIDRGFVALRLGRVEVTAGRQAVGWGRGVLFGAIDLFAPFSPLEADREWRRGVDAVKADVRLTERISLDVIGAFGQPFQPGPLDSSALAGRVRGYAGKVDLELVGGWRARDVFGGLATSAALGDAEAHGELALFRAPDALPAGGQLGARGAIKAVAGGSYRFPLGKGLLAFLEYHYSGFGAARAADILPLVANPDFQRRFLRGDSQILGRHAIALLANYEWSPDLTLGGLCLQSPVDGSGVVAPSATLTLGDRLSVLGTVYVPYGAAPVAGVLASEYGAAALSALVQIRVYD
jgi:hypothetical protein